MEADGESCDEGSLGGSGWVGGRTPSDMRPSSIPRPLFTIKPEDDERNDHGIKST